MKHITSIFPAAAMALILFVLYYSVPRLNKPEGRSLIPEADRRFRRRDCVLVSALTLAYAAVAFFQVGDRAAPQSFCHFDDLGYYVVIELAHPAPIGALEYYTGLNSGFYRLQFSADGEEWVDQASMEQSYENLFKWEFAELAQNNPAAVRYVRIISGSELYLGEVALYDGQGARIKSDALLYDDGAAPLFDEQNTVPSFQTYLNSTYFDEVYHARAAYEFVQNIYPYEISHPPLGKLLLSLGIRLFGMTPFGWRFMGTLFGVLMVPVFYVFSKKLFGGCAVPFCCTAVFAFDFMHYTQTRIATIDAYAVFFICLMYLFLYLYLCAPRSSAAPRRGWLPWLGLSGLSFALGVACKWTCLYAGTGLAVLWLFDLLERARDAAKKAGRPARVRAVTENILWCLLFFVLVPAVIYYLSYIPYGTASGMHGAGMLFSRNYLALVLENQRFMFTYHAGVSASHPFASRWYQWLLDIRPIRYFLAYFGDGTRSSLFAFVNPMLCWGGLAAMPLMAYRALRVRDRRAAFILVGYLAQLLPWLPVSRATFAYHYFPCTVFLTLALGHVFASRRDRDGRVWPMATFTAASVGLFAVFYPVLSGLRVPGQYTDNFLRWLPNTWPF